MIRSAISFLVFLLLLSSCKETYTPKPRGYIRIEPPEAKYVTLDEELPYSFSVSRWAVVELPPVDSAAYWINIDYPALNAKIYCSYRSITQSSLDVHMEECRRLVERAVRNADVISEKVYESRNDNVYGVLFQIEGESASPVQFVLTDSVLHFFRGAFYYKYNPNRDSVAPITDYIKKDIIELIQTFYWRD